MLTQTINLLASARPNLGGQGAGLVSGRGGGRRGTTGGVGEDNCAGRGDDAQDGRRQGGEEDDAAAAEPRRSGRTTWRRRRTARQRRRRSPRGWGGRRQVGKEAARVPGADGGGPAAWRGERVSAYFGRPAAAKNPVGQRTGGAAEAAVG
jgi:hypothetical protein